LKIDNKIFDKLIRNIRSERNKLLEEFLIKYSKFIKVTPEELKKRLELKARNGGLEILDKNIGIIIFGVYPKENGVNFVVKKIKMDEGECSE
jgi:hypothetical protein